VQYSFQHLTRYSEVQRIRRFQNRAKEVAWGSLNPPSNKGLTKRVKVAIGDNSNGTVSMSVTGDGEVSIVNARGQLELLDESAARKPSLGSTWIPTLFKSTIEKIRSKPVSIQSLPDSTTLGDVDAIVPSIEVGSESDTGRSGANTPVDGDAPQLTNRKARRQQVKDSRKKK